MIVESLRYIESKRQGKTQWLNVVQGLDEGSTKVWFDAVKWFRCDGRALASNADARGGLYNALNTVLMMREDDAFASVQDWVHV